MRILALIDGYLPGYKHGGPVQSLANMVARMGDYYQFCIYGTVT